MKNQLFADANESHTSNEDEACELIKSFCYATARFSLGLLIHPYQTMQLLVKQKMFVWIAMLPTILLSASFLLSRAWTVIFSKMAFSLTPVLFNLPELYSFVSTWLTVFCLYWQLMLLYLLLRFNLAMARE